MASRKIREKWGPWKQYPDDFKTITESQVLGDKHRLSWFVELGLTCANMDILLTSMTAPSSNLVKLSTILRVKPEELDALANEGVTVTRLDNENYNYVSSDGYDELGWWRGCEFRISGGIRLVYNYWGSRTALAYLAHRISAKQLRLSLSLKAWLKRRLGRQRFSG
jgi:hypothetical protein